MMKSWAAFFAMAAMVALSACSSNPGKGEKVGTVGGAVGGAAVGSAVTGGSAIGTLGGAALGGYAGNRAGQHYDKEHPR